MKKLLLRKLLSIFFPELSHANEFADINLTTGIMHHPFGHVGEFDSDEQAILSAYLSLTEAEQLKIISRLIETDFYLITDALVRMRIDQIHSKKYLWHNYLLCWYLKYK
ncbi:hypothetical protein [Leuconostoc citreum]|uniref:hypothetical protein n=1 Tax=Leuconostoc citreum TaxID=33964 RepID=UPI0032DE36E1